MKFLISWHSWSFLTSGQALKSSWWMQLRMEPYCGVSHSTFPSSPAVGFNSFPFAEIELNFKFFKTSPDFYSPCASHLSTISSSNFIMWSFSSKTFSSKVFAFSPSKPSSVTISVSSKMQSVEQHHVLNDGSFGRVQLAMQFSLISGLKSSGTVQHSIGSLETFGQNLHSLSSRETKSSEKECWLVSGNEKTWKWFGHEIFLSQGDCVGRTNGINTNSNQNDRILHDVHCCNVKTLLILSESFYRKFNKLYVQWKTMQEMTCKLDKTSEKNISWVQAMLTHISELYL